MLMLIAGAVAAAQPATPAPASPQAGHSRHMQMGQSAQHKDMDCCKDCCKEMATKHEGHEAERGEQTAQ